MQKSLLSLVLLIIAFIGMSFEGGCGKNTTDNPSVTNPINATNPTSKQPTDMKWITDLLKSDDYNAAWREVEKAESQGLTEDAQKMVQAIYERAQTDNNAAQIVKSLLHRYKFSSYNEENSDIKAVQSLRDEIAAAPMPLKAILQSILADVYWQYFEANRYTLLQRSDANGISDDFKTWDANRFTTEITALHLAALQDVPNLQKVNLNTIDALLSDSNKESRNLRPTLYDFLAHRALDFFMNDQADITKAADQFQISDAAAFADAQTFVNAKFSTTDPLSVKFYALQLLQQLSAAHLKDEQPDALIDIELKRLGYAKNKSTLPNRNDRYLQALEALADKYKQHKAAAEVYYPIAQWHYEKASEYDPFAAADSPTAKLKNEYKKALEICYATSRQYASTTGASNCDALAAQINQKELSFQAERANLPQQAFRALLTYRNINQVYCRALLLDKTIQEKADAMRDENKRLAYYRSLAPTEKWSIALPKDDDLRAHSTEIKIPALPIGNYMLMVSTAEDMSDNKNAFAYQYTNSTNLALLTRDKSYSETLYFAVHRETGQPLPNINYEMYLQTWDYNKNSYTDQKLSAGKTDKDGAFTQPKQPSNQYGNLKIVLINGNDRFEHSDHLRSYNNYTEQSHTQTLFFTDRAIYRPGQTLYFKGITLLVKSDNKNEVVSNQATTVTLYDANGQEAGKLDLKTNEYGSFNGKFILPSNLLNGVFTLRNDNGSSQVRVEEYKRPKFAVSYEPVKGSYRLNESVTVIGNAKAFAGNNIDGADVKYRVVRTAHFPWWGWWCWWRIPDAATNALEVKQGTTTTDADGKFTVTFTALPDPTLDPNQKPQYSYQVIADVTDINGETRSNTTTVEVGYVSLLVSADMSDNIDKRGKITTEISSTNLGGQTEPATLNIAVYELQQPDRLLRNRLWQRPDKFLMTQTDYIKNFPNDIYDNENDPATWQRGKTILEKTINTANDSILKLDALHDAKVGKYVLEITGKDKFGEKVAWKKLFTLYDLSNDDMPEKALLWSLTDKASAEPTETVTLAYGSSAKDAKILVEIEQNNFTIRREWLPVSDAVKLLTQKVAEEWRGGFAIRLGMVRLNRFEQANYLVNVPWSNKDLTIEKESFRSKLYPGQAEEWRLKITGAKSEKIAAEMVATLYDASLDEFVGHYFPNFSYPSYGAWGSLNADYGFSVVSSNLSATDWNTNIYYAQQRQYEYLNWFGFNIASGGYRNYAMQSMVMRDGGGRTRSVMKKGAVMSAAPTPAPAGAMMDGDMAMAESKIMAKEESPQMEMATKNGGGNDKPQSGKSTDFGEVRVRKNLQELAFFMPDLRTNDKGEIIMSFTMPEALSKWKMLGFAHTKDAKFGQIEASTITQKDLMVMPNLPRFLREGDDIYISTKIANQTDQNLSGDAILKLFDAATMQPIDAKLNNSKNIRPFTAQAKQSTAVEWLLHIPADVSAVVCQIVAKSGNVSDGEENALPILTNRMLVTESMPLPIRGTTSKQFKFDNLAKANASNTLSHHSLTVEMTSNPAWYAVQALPYLMEYPYECTEQIFSRYYANSIAQHVANSSPDIKKVFDTWLNEAITASTNSGKDVAGALLSNLEKNQELKQLVLQETPWVMQAKDETERKHRVGLLFDLEKMSREMSIAEKELMKRQTPSGGWTWFPGMPDDRYITQHILCGMGHLNNLGVRTVRENGEIWSMIQRAVRVIDQKMQEDYDNLLRHKANLNQDNTTYTTVHYLYTRSFFRDIPVEGQYQKAFDYYKGQIEKYWLNKGTYMNGMTALALHRWDNGDNKTALDIMKSLKQNTVKSEEMGMYFKDNRGGWYWYQAPIETQALIIEAFDEVTNDQEAVNELKVWLLKQKQTQDWKTTKATAEACYALLLRGGKWLASKEIVEVIIGSQTLPKDKPELQLEAGTGYYKTRWNANDIKADMGNITVNKKDEGVSWGAVYWQYFEQLDKITRAETPLTITKKLYKESATKSGLKLDPLSDGATLHVGDMLKVRIEIKVDRDMEYVHLKDMRAAGFEPTNVLSQYKWQDGLGYYESTKDAATNFFMNWLPKGTYVFEYPLRVSQKGNFSNGITTMQCMYAPEFSSHSEGIRVKVVE